MPASMHWPIVTVAITQESDVVRVRQRARRIAELLGLGVLEQTRVATAASEIARNAFAYAGRGKAEFLLDGERRPQLLLIRVTDEGPGIADLDAILEGRYHSLHGMGLGLAGAKRLMDHFSIESAPGRGTRIELGQRLGRAFLLERKALTELAADLHVDAYPDSLAELQAQNRELLLSLQEVRSHQSEIEELNRELADTNRGVVALHAELETHAEELRRASETKSRFLSNLSHELRTPLNSILALSRLLLDRVDGELTTEQERQVSYIARSGETLLDMVNDLLDLAKVESGQVSLRLSSFSVEEMLSGLRGALKPLRVNPAVELAFEVGPGAQVLHSDEGKVAQILRNLLSNALKFTPSGTVRLDAALSDDRRTMIFSVSDTGIGIPEAEQERIFEEFTQIDNPMQKHHRGTGLGLPLARRLAGLLGGALSVSSTPGQGSTFQLHLPLVSRPLSSLQRSKPKRVLIVDDDATFRYILRQQLGSFGGLELREAADGREGLERTLEWRPDLLIVDLQMPGRDGFALLQDLAEAPGPRPATVVLTSLPLDAELLKRLPNGIAVYAKQSIAETGPGRLLHEIDHD